MGNGKKFNVEVGDFYLADLLSEGNKTIIQELYAVLESDHYQYGKIKTLWAGKYSSVTVTFKDNQEAHKSFWNLYERPPKEEFWDDILKRRDLLVEPDIRERKGAFYTPKIWVRKAQEYLAKSLGEDWQDEYYIWDLAAGTGNLLIGLSTSNIYASTLDKADVIVCQEIAKKSGNLLERNVFQFDFLNDEFFDEPCREHGDSKFAVEGCEKCRKSPLPESLQEIIRDSEKRKRLVVFINPPYAEATSKYEMSKEKESKSTTKNLVAKAHKMVEKYKKSLGPASNELFAQFFMKIIKELDGCILASFSTLKYINSQNFIQFRTHFKAEFKGGFIAPSYTFDNVRVSFPIGFLIWDTSVKKSLRG